jgi:hypothetical protein
LFVHIFCVTDVSSPNTFLSYGYREDDGGKGGDIIVSLLHQSLQDLGWLRDEGCGKRLSILMDNSTFHHKKKELLRLALLYVESSFFSKVEFIFFFRGHTKNLCNNFKQIIQSRCMDYNIYSVSQLSDVLNLVNGVTFTHVNCSLFLKYNESFDIYYKVSCFSFYFLLFC